MRYLIPFTLIPLLSHAATIGGADGQWNGGDKNGAPGGGFKGGDGQWTGIPAGQTNHPSWSGRPQGSAAPAPPAPPVPVESSIAPAVPAAPVASPAWSPAPSPDSPPAAISSPAAPASSPDSPPAAAVPSSILPVLPFATPSSVASIIPGIPGGALSPIPFVPSSFAPLPTAAPTIPMGTGLIAPSNGDSIPAAQCSPGGKPGGPWLPFVRAQSTSDPSAMCPTDNTNNIHWFLDSDKLGCCPQNAYITTARRSQWACCPCGSSCAGLPPAPFQDWSISTGKLFVGGSPYTIPSGGIGLSGTITAVPKGGNAPNAPSPTQAPNVVKGPNGSPISLAFTPTSSSSSCNAANCQIFYYGPNTVATLLAPAGQIYTRTTATAVLFGTVSGRVIPTFTTYAMVTAEAGAAAARPTGLVGVGVVGAIAGAMAAAAIL